MKPTPFERFKRYAVQSSSVKDFLDRYHRPASYTGRGAEYTDGMVKEYEDEVAKYGFCFISHHDSVTGDIVSWYPEQTGGTQ